MMERPLSPELNRILRRLALLQVADSLEEGRDYYLTEDGLLVFTAEYLRKRGFCCRSGCRHCPYQEENPPADTPETEENSP